MADYIRKSDDPLLPGWRLRVSRDDDGGIPDITFAEEIVLPDQVDNPAARHRRRNMFTLLTLADAVWLRDALTAAIEDRPLTRADTEPGS